jgi:hypothetical protein
VTTASVGAVVRAFGLEPGVTYIVGLVSDGRTYSLTYDGCQVAVLAHETIAVLSFTEDVAPDAYQRAQGSEGWTVPWRIPVGSLAFVRPPAMEKP